MMKLLTLLGVIFSVIYILRQRSNTLRKTSSSHHSSDKERTSSSTAITMVQCEHCGVHIPQNEAVTHQGHTWCSLEHKRLSTEK